jgi:hypothetical protein
VQQHGGYFCPFLAGWAILRGFYTRTLFHFTCPPYSVNCKGHPKSKKKRGTNMKKILAFALSAVMALALLAGCGNQTDNNSSSKKI